MISRSKGWNNARATSLSVLVHLVRSVATARFRNTRNYWRVPIVEQRFDIWDTSYRRRFTVIIPLPRGARVCSTPISVTLARRTRIRLSFRGKLNGHRICGIRAFRPGGCFLQPSFRMENSVQGNHKHPPFPSSNIGNAK